MGTIFMNSENSKTSKRHVLILKLTNNLDLTLFRMEGGGANRGPLYQFFPCNFYKRKN